MKISRIRLLRVISILIIITTFHLLGAANDQDLIELEPGYEDVLYTYYFKLNNPPGVSNVKWQHVTGRGDYPEGMKLESSGFFHGKPVLHNSENQEEEVLVRERDYTFTLQLSGKIHNAKKTELVDFVKLYQVYFKVQRSPRWNLAENKLLLIGMEQSGASSADPTQRVFSSLYISSPFPIGLDTRNSPRRKLGKRLQMWGEVKLTSLPQQITDPLIKAPETFNNTIKNLKINEIARSIEFLLGFDLRLLDLRSRGRQKWYTINFIGAFGASTPTTPKDSAQIFKLPTDPNAAEIQQLQKRYNLGDLSGKKYITFVKPDRSKFYRQWYFGFRIKSYKKPQPIVETINGTTVRNKMTTRFPTYFEVAFGRNDFIVDRELMLEMSGNNMIALEDMTKWRVLKISGFIPIKIKSFSFYFFGSAMLQFIRNKNSTPLLNTPIILEPALDKTIYPDSETVQTTLLNENRDYYRIGVGVDLMGFLKKIF